MIQNKALPPFKSYPPSRKDPAACRGELDLFNTRYWLYLFIIFHLVGWTLVPAVIRHNLPIDSIEGSIWGQQLEWGYDKNPFLNGWLTALAIYLSHRSDWMIYFFSQLSVVICFLSVWHLARTILPATLALLAVLLLEGVQYYNFHAIDFNDNTLELSLFSLTIYFFYQALHTKTYRAWCATGCFAALCLMAKYYAIVLFIPMFLFLLLYPENRNQLKTIRPYCGLLLFILIILPHFIWLFSNDFVTVRYAFERVGNPPSWRNHLFFPLQFAWQQLEVFLPALFLFGIFFIGKKPFLAPQKISSFNKLFLFWMGLGPFLTTLLLSLLFGMKLRAGWGMPLLSLWGILLLVILTPHLTKAKLYRFITVIFIFIPLLLSTYSFSLMYSKTETSANFPGHLLAKTMEKKWNDTYHTPLFYVGGSRWMSGNVSYYSNNHPTVFIEWNPLFSPWINQNEMKKRGALFVWDITNGESLPKAVQEKFKNLTPPRTLELNWERNQTHLPPIQIGFVLLPPEKATA